MLRLKEVGDNPLPRYSLSVSRPIISTKRGVTHRTPRFPNNAVNQVNDARYNEEYQQKDENKPIDLESVNILFAIRTVSDRHITGCTYTYKAKGENMFLASDSNL